VEIHTVSSFFKQLLGIDVRKAVTVPQWLTFSEQALLEATSGEAFPRRVGRIETDSQVAQVLPP